MVNSKHICAAFVDAALGRVAGYAALNKLLGREVYTSHMQLGGPKVMGANGVSHHVVPDDLEGVKAIIRCVLESQCSSNTHPCCRAGRATSLQVGNAGFARANGAMWMHQQQHIASIMSCCALSTAHYEIEIGVCGFRWLSYAPPLVGGSPLPLSTSDPINRTIAYTLPEGTLLACCVASH